MHRFRPISSIAGLVVLVAAVAVLAGTTPPDQVMIDDCQAKQAAVKFDHKAHMAKTDCVTCHHTQEGLTADSGTDVQPCGSCHIAPEKAETPKCSEMSMSKNPFHNGCVNCHKEAIKKDATVAAPTKCAECHPKAS